jgi:dTDP-4-dehydrorhamnose reductase
MLHGFAAALLLDVVPRCRVKVAVIGANGQLGSDVVAEFAANGDEVCSLTHADIDVESFESVRSCLHVHQPEAVINTAAMHHVEDCEAQPAKAYVINAIGSRNLALVASELGALLIHISTDYVFDGKKNKPYVEEDAPLPLNVYGNSKLAGEHFVRSLSPKHLVLRTSALYGHHRCRAKRSENFVDLMLKLARERGRVRVVDDEFVSPTSTLDLARQIVALSRCDAYGLYHATGEGSCSWYEFAREIFELTRTSVNLEVAGANEFPAKVPRPKYSVLENAALKRIELSRLAPWPEALREYLHQGREVELNKS